MSKKIITEIFNRCKAEDEEYFITLNKLAVRRIEKMHEPLDMACEELSNMIYDKYDEYCDDNDIPVNRRIDIDSDEVFWDETWGKLYNKINK